MKSLLLTTVLLIASTCASAATITSGWLTVSTSGIGPFRFISSEFDLRGGLYVYESVWWALNCSPCAPGDVLKGSGVVSGDDLFGTDGWIGSTYYPNLRYGPQLMGPGSLFEFTTPSFTYAGEHTKTLPFTFSGFINAYAGDYNDSDCILCMEPLTGSGYTVIRYNPDAVPGISFAQEQTFFFTSAVPEPATAYLLIPGAFLLFLSRKRLSRSIAQSGFLTRGS